MKTRLFYGSSYDRGLDILLKMWPKILKKYPDATLQICYGWDIFDKGYADNPERMAWKERINKLMTQKGITHHGRIGRDELKKVRQSCDIWVYPTYFAEINCITALECQADGVVPVTMDHAALKETVQSGVKIQGDIYDEETQDKFVEELLKLMGDDKRWEEESKKAIKFTKDYEWDEIESLWAQYLK
jgi:glycosyltransferase involved in cell wall biosynthesis